MTYIQNYSDAAASIWEKEWNQPKHLPAGNWLNKSSMWRNMVHFYREWGCSLCSDVEWFPSEVEKSKTQDAVMGKWLYYHLCGKAIRPYASVFANARKKVQKDTYRRNCNSGYLWGKELGNWGMSVRGNYFTMYLLNQGRTLAIANAEYWLLHDHSHVLSILNFRHSQGGRMRWEGRNHILGGGLESWEHKAFICSNFHNGFSLESPLYCSYKFQLWTTNLTEDARPPPTRKIIVHWFHTFSSEPFLFNISPAEKVSLNQNKQK